MVDIDSSQFFIDEGDTAAPPPASAPNQTPMEAYAGGMGNVLNAMTLGFGDEIVAGGSGALDYFLGGPGYDARLEQIRGLRQDFRDENPVSATLGDIGGALQMPGNLFGVAKKAAPSTASLFSKGVQTAKNLFSNVGRGAAEGATYGVAYGIGEGEGGLEERLSNAAELLPSALMFGGAAGTLQGGLRGAAKAVDDASDEFLAQALNVQRSDLKRSARFSPASGSRASPLKIAIKSVKDKGLFKGATNTDSIIARNETAIDDLGGSISGLLNKATKAQVGEVVPTFKHASKFIDDHPYEAEQLVTQFQKRQDAIAQMWDGSINSLQTAKQKLYKIAYKGTTESRAFDQALARDLKEAIEQGAPKDIAAQIKSLNREQGQHLAIRELLEKNKLQEEMPGGIAKALRRAIVSPIGGGALGVGTSLYTDDPKYAALGLAGGAATTRAGQLILSDLASKAAPKVRELASAPASALFASLKTAPEATDLGNINAGSDSFDSNQFYIDEGDTMTTDTKPPQVTAAPIKQDVAAIEQEIDKDPYMSALYEAESGRNPLAKNPTSSASGAFQLINSTAKNLGVEDPFDMAQNYAGALKLTDTHRAKFGNDPAKLYMAHYLGETVLRKLLNRQQLSAKEQAQVDYLQKKALPDFLKIYNRKVGLVEA